MEKTIRKTKLIIEGLEKQKSILEQAIKELENIEGVEKAQELLLVLKKNINLEISVEKYWIKQKEQEQQRKLDIELSKIEEGVSYSIKRKSIMGNTHWLGLMGARISYFEKQALAMTYISKKQALSFMEYHNIKNDNNFEYTIERNQ